MIAYKIKRPDCLNKSGYGIDVFDNTALIKSIDNFTDSKSDAEKIADLCNELQVEPCHLEDIIEDYLTDFII
ncbi:MAG: DUF6514 family protein [Clostridiales bacterium]|nr:DUF6514 family protein [Clostridiales bacterium]